MKLAAVVRSRVTAIRLALVAALLAIAAIPLLPVIVAPGFPSHYEGFRYEVLTQLFMDGVAHGQAYPRWLPALSGGRGYPTFVFYQPLIFFLTATLRTIGAPLITVANATYVADYLTLAVGVAGAYRLARTWLPTERSTSLALSLLFALTPYLFTNIHVRGDHSELASMMFTPWPLVALRAIERRLTATAGAPRIFWPVVGGALTLAGIVLGHPAPALVYGLTLTLLVAVRLIAFADGVQRRRWIIACAAMALLALLVCSPYWFPLIQCRGYARLDRAVSGEFSPVRHLISPLEVLFDRAGPPSAADMRADRLVPVGLGVAHATLALAGAALCLRAGPRRMPWGYGCAVAFLAMIALMSPWAEPIWAWPTPLMMLQFPFRVVSVTTVVQFVLAIHAVVAIAGVRLAGRASAIRAAVIVGACLFTIAWHHGMFHAEPTLTAATPSVPARPFTWAESRWLLDDEIRGLPFRNADFELIHEFDPIWHVAIGVLRGDAPLFAGDAAITPLPGSDVYHPAVEIRAARPTAIVFRQLFFPGWRVALNGTAIPDDDLIVALLPDGQMVIAVPAGTSRIVAAYDGPPQWRLRVALTLAAIVATLVWLARTQRRWPTTLTRAASPSPGTAPAP